MPADLKLVTFIGMGLYEATLYGFGPVNSPNFAPVNVVNALNAAGSGRTRFVPIALTQHLQPKTVLMVGPQDAIGWAKTNTGWPEGKDANGKPIIVQAHTLWDELAAALPAGADPAQALQEVSLAPSDQLKTEELWKLFGSLTPHLNAGDTVAFDITHSFRMFPFLAFLAVAFLRVARDIKLEGIYYGSYQPRSNSPQTEIMDIGEFVDLLDWTTAAERFIKAGDGRPLARELKDIGMAEAGETVDHVSRALLMNQATDVMAQAVKIPTRTAPAQALPAPKRQPLNLLLAAAHDSFRKLALQAPENSNNAKRNVQAQRNLLQWYREKKLWGQAILLTQELLKAYVCYRTGMDIYKTWEGGDRDQAFRLIKGQPLTFGSRTNPNTARNSRVQAKFDRLPEANDLRALWRRADAPAGQSHRFDKLRNAVAHAGFTDTKFEGDQLIRECAWTVDEVLAFFNDHTEFTADKQP